MTTAFLLGAAITLGQWYQILVTVAAAAWLAKVAFQDRLPTSEEKQIRARLRKTMP